MKGITLPAGFRFGVATAAYQIEGGWDADGKAPSVWDTLAHNGAGFVGGATGDVACDHYRRWRQDLDLLARLGADSYRFSVSWPRVQPTGKGRWNPAGLDFYDRLVDALLERGVEPTVTLYHWDHPQAIEDTGGWLNPDTARRFADYATGVAQQLGDRVARWITLNEPLSVLTGHALGFSRPAGPLGLRALPTAHTMLLAHGLAVRALRAVTPRVPVGITVDIHDVEPASDHPDDVDAASRAHIIEDRLFVDPLLLGRYPDLDGRPILPAPDPAEMSVITTPLDFLGINWYAPARVGHPWRHAPRRRLAGHSPLDSLLAGQAETFGFIRTPWPEAPSNPMGWPVVPDRLGDALRRLHDSYPNHPPLLITENGYPAADTVDADGRVRDGDRIDYLERCLRQLALVSSEGIDVRGYFVWSLLDNLEWGLGFGPRFGLVHVDFASLLRTPKDSFHWYADLISRHRRAHAAHGEPVGAA